MRGNLKPHSFFGGRNCDDPSPSAAASSSSAVGSGNDAAAIRAECDACRGGDGDGRAQNGGVDSNSFHDGGCGGGGGNGGIPNQLDGDIGDGDNGDNGDGGDDDDGDDDDGGLAAHSCKKHPATMTILECDKVDMCDDEYDDESAWSYTSEEMQLDGGYSKGLDGHDDCLAELLTNQRWHEVGNGPHPICASSDFDVMVDQISSILSVRLRDLLVAKTRTLLGGGDPLDPIFHRPSASFSSHSSHASIENGVKNNNIKNIGNCAAIVAKPHDALRFDQQRGDYVLVESISDSILQYVTCIGGLYNDVGFHSFEHAVHVTISMNKLLSMVYVNKEFGEHLTMSSNKNNDQPPPNSSSHDARFSRSCPTAPSLGSSSGGGAENLSYGIGEDPLILFAMVFSALIHDVGHTGVPNSVLVEEEDELAILHNDVSVAEQNSLQVAFSMLQRDEFAGLKKCICPTPEDRRIFRKKVISMIMVTDISDQERIQIVASRWNAAFPPGGGRHGIAERRHSRSVQYENQQLHPLKKEIQSTELKAAINRHRFSMFSTDAAVEEFATESRRLGIRTSMDFSGMLLDAYHSVDQLKQHAVLETMMNAADVAHTMQSFRVFVKWNKRLFRELYVAHMAGRLSFDPCENWYENQIGFFKHYILPLTQKMKTCGVFGHTGSVFGYFAMENKKRWMKEGEDISERIICDVKEEVEQGGQGLPDRCAISDCRFADYAPTFS
jgi:hypothetical protein